jgi:hypothetical protein
LRSDRPVGGLAQRTWIRGCFKKLKAAGDPACSFCKIILTEIRPDGACQIASALQEFLQRGQHGLPDAAQAAFSWPGARASSVPGDQR